MKLSTKTRYATRAMLDLALSYESGPLTAKEIANNQQVSAKYLESLLAVLRSAGFVRSVRGAKGGHMLAKPPDQITLRQIFEILEGNEGLVHCTTKSETCERANICVTQEVWVQMYAACIHVLESMTLADLARRAKEKGDSLAVMYYI